MCSAPQLELPDFDLPDLNSPHSCLAVLRGERVHYVFEELRPAGPAYFVPEVRLSRASLAGVAYFVAYFPLLPQFTASRGGQIQ